MEWVELSSVSLAEAMFVKLGLPKPIYHVQQLVQGGYKTQVQFQHSTDFFRSSTCQTTLAGPFSLDRERSMNRAADVVIKYMEAVEKKNLVDYNYYQLEKQKKASREMSVSLLEKSEEIKDLSKKTLSLAREACNYAEEVQAAANKIHGLTAVALDRATSMSVCDLKQALFKIHSEVVALQNTTKNTQASLLEKEIAFQDDIPDPVYSGPSNGESDEDYHQDIDGDYRHYVRSP